MVSQIYSNELQLNKADFFDNEAPFMDLNVPITSGNVSSTIYDELDDFSFEMINFPFLVEMFHAPLAMVYTFCKLFVLREYVLMLVTSTNRNKFLTSKILKQGYQCHKLLKSFS